MSAVTTGATQPLLELLEGLRGASKLGRARILARAAQVIRRLTGEQRKQLALEVARHAAPDLAPRIEAATGGDLSGRQVGTLIDLIRKLDNDQLAEVAIAIRTGGPLAPEVREAVTVVARDVLDAIEPPAGEPVAESVVQPEPTESREELLEELAVPGEELVAPVVADVEIAEPVVVEEPEPVPVIDDWSTFDDSFDEPEFEEPDVASDEAVELQREIRAELDEQEADRRAEVLAVPDGWRRRRRLLDLVAQDAIADDEAVALLGLLARDSDRAWVAGALLDRGLVIHDQIASLVPERTAKRLLTREAA